MMQENNKSTALFCSFDTKTFVLGSQSLAGEAKEEIQQLPGAGKKPGWSLSLLPLVHKHALCESVFLITHLCVYRNEHEFPT